jgi:dimethylglycine dehydrogenase
VGLALANWMIERDPGFDVWAMDVARYGDWATPAYTNAKVRENYGRRFSVTFPNEELPAARPLRISPLYGRQKAKGAVFGAAFGLEYPLWFAPAGMAPVEEVTFRRSNAHGPVGEEVRAVREAVGVIETTGYARYQFSGPGAESFLDRMLTNRMPEIGRIVLAPMLNEAGKLIGDFTVARLSAECFHVFGSGPAEDFHSRWWEQHMPETGVDFVSLRDTLAGLSIAGPHARALLAALVTDDVSNSAFGFMHYRRMNIGMVPATIGRLTFTGDLGYEIWVAPDRLAALYDAVFAAGAGLGVRDVGLRALNAMRLEKNFGTWAREYRPIYGPYEAGLGRFVNLKKGEFIGREAALREKAHGGRLRLVSLVVEAGDADVVGDEPVWLDGKAIGWVTSGGYAHHIVRSMALAYVPAEYAVDGAVFQVEILDEMRVATLVAQPLFDPNGGRMRG